MIRLEGTIRRYIGLSSDDKPVPVPSYRSVDGSNVVSPAEIMLVGSSFMETDTGKIWRWDGRTWIHYEAEDENKILLSMILTELVGLSAIVQLTVGAEAPASFM